MDPAKISVIMPVYNGGASWGRCLDALAAAEPPPGQVIIVDDGSTDDTREQAAARGFTVLRTESPRGGPAVARNFGSLYATGEILFFVDADVLIPREAIARVAEALKDSQVSAIFGSYDDAPDAAQFVSQFKNLFHHYVHQTSRRETTSFWAGCGAIRREVFREVGGFSPRYTRPSIEDVEMGFRLHRSHFRVCLVKELQVKHLKRWTLRSLIATDIFCRAIPWALLILSARDLPNDLNLQASHRLSTVLCFLLVLALLGGLLSPFALLLVLPLGVGLFALNFGLYRFFYDKRGLFFLLRAVPLHWLYYLYSGIAFGVALMMSVWQSVAWPVRFSRLRRAQTDLPR